MGRLNLRKIRVSAVKQVLPNLKNYFFNVEDPQARRRLQILVVSGGIFILFLIVNSVLFSLTSQPSFCEICHEMRPDVRAWRKSLHAEVNCYACHSQPGVLSLLGQKGRLMREVYLHLTNNYEKPINAGGRLSARIPDERCEQCHTVKRKITPTRGIIIDHVKHKKNKISCTTCHNRAAHLEIEGYVAGVKKVAGVYRDRMKMAACLVCHNDVRAPKKCETCHPPTFAFAPTKGEMAHNETWQQTHGKRATTNPQPCYYCHEKDSCADCHGIALPHTQEFTMTANHGQSAKQNIANCLRCHPDQRWCNSCHHKGYRAEMGPWIRFHRTIAREQGVADCFNCHNPVYCARCHVGASTAP